MNCPNCNSHIPDASDSCPNCNSPLTPPPPPQAEAVETIEQTDPSTSVERESPAAETTPNPRQAPPPPPPAAETAEALAQASAADAPPVPPSVADTPSTPLATADAPPVPPSAPSPADWEQTPPAQDATGALTKKKSFRIAIISVCAALLVVGGIFAFIALKNHFDGIAYAEATELMDAGNYAEAYEGFSNLGDFEDAESKAYYCGQVLEFEKGMQLIEDGEYEQAREVFVGLEGFMDADSQVLACDA